MCLICKQKTAYEMRISDWSSDVCSSDLIAERAETWIVDRLGLAEAHRDDPRIQILEYSDRDNRHGSSPRGEDWHQMLEDHALQLVAGELCDQEIGRASCREGVCQYVYI